MKYKAFISYSHVADGKLAASLEETLETIAKPRYQLRTFDIFRDQTDLSLSPHLWGEIEKSLQESEFFILLASPESAQSHWVQKEIHYWLENKPKENLIVALTRGSVLWDEKAGDFDWLQTNALAKELSKAFPGEPLYADLSNLDQVKELNLQNGDFIDAIKSIAAKLHNKTVGELFGEIERQHKKTLRIRNGTIILLSLLFLVSIGLFFYAYNRQIEAELQRDKVQHQLAMSYWDQARSLRNNGEIIKSLLLGAEGVNIIDADLVTSLLFDLETIPFLIIRPEGNVTEAVLSKDEKRVLSLSFDRTIRLWDIKTQKQIGESMQHDGYVDGAVFSKDEKRILSWSEDKTIRLWDVKTHKQIGESIRHDGYVEGAVFSKDEKRILSWSRDSTIRLWDVETHKQIGESIQHDGYVIGAVFSKDEKRILSWSFDRTIRLWDVGTQKQIGESMQHNSHVEGAVFSKDEKRILSWGWDGTIRLWKVKTQKQIGESMRHDNVVYGSVFSKDEKRILSWGWDGTIRLWKVKTQK
ncbi:MAG: TIR domain-containing protein, partial [Ignavibacteriaceae bacterium]